MSAPDTQPADIEADIAAVLKANNVAYSALLLGQRKREDWDCDAWSIVFSTAKDGRERAETFDYFTGLGRRQYVSGPKSPLTALAGKPNTLFREKYDKEHKRPVAPCAADVLCSLIHDSSAVGQSFESWCEEFGYNSDSRKAERLYHACQENADKLVRVLGRGLIGELSTMLENY